MNHNTRYDIPFPSGYSKMHAEQTDIIFPPTKGPFLLKTPSLFFSSQPFWKRCWFYFIGFHFQPFIPPLFFPLRLISLRELPLKLGRKKRKEWASLFGLFAHGLIWRGSKKEKFGWKKVNITGTFMLYCTSIVCKLREISY